MIADRASRKGPKTRRNAVSGKAVMPRGGDSEIKWGGKRAGAGQKPAPGESFKAARRRKESALADLRQLEVRTRRGVVVERDAVERSAFKWARVQRDAWLR